MTKRVHEKDTQTVTLVFSLEALNDFEDFLESRESDIALDMENFGALEKIFFEYFGRKPSE